MRCYWGCPDSELQALIDHRASKTKELTAAHKDARCVYFPMEEKYQVFVNHKMIGSFSFDQIEAIDSAILKLKETHDR